MKKKRKKVLLIFLLILIVVSLYGINRNSKVQIADTTDQYLQQCGIHEYSISELADYRKKKIEVSEVTVTEEEIAEYINTVMESCAYMQPMENKTIVELGDFVYVSYSVYENGIEVNKVQDDVLKVGAGYYDVQFEEWLIGKEVGQEFIENARDDTSDKEHTYRIVINSIQEYVTYSLDDSFVQENLGLQSVDEFYEQTEKTLLKEKKGHMQKEAEKKLLEILVDESEIQFNEKEIAEYAKRIIQNYSQLAYIYNMDLEEYYKSQLSLNKTKFYEMCYDEARTEIGSELIVGAIAYNEDISLSNAEILQCQKEGDEIKAKQNLLKKKVIHILKEE